MTRSREQKIIRTSLVGIAANMGLTCFKALIGFLSNSIAIVLDALNNLTDALSSVITILGARYSTKPADRDHPFGHGRIEYFASELIAMLVIYAGITALIASVRKIIASEEAVYRPLFLVVIAVAVAVKVILSVFYQKRGVQTRSDALINSGVDARMDALISASTLAAALLNVIWGIQLEAWLGAAISLFIIRSGVIMLKDTVSQLLGRRADASLAREIRGVISGIEPVLGVCDLFLTDYGPNRTLGAVHIEVPDTLSATEIDSLTRRVQDTCLERCGVVMTAVGIYAQNIGDDRAASVRAEVYRMVTAHPGVLQIHGFYLDMNSQAMRFDVILDFDLKDRQMVYQEILEEVSSAWPDWRIQITLDSDISD